jgi:hypothetical protein
MSTDLHAGLAFSLHAMSADELKSEKLQELVIHVAMEEDCRGSTLRPVLDHLLLGLMELRDIERQELDDEDDTPPQLDYPDDPEAYFFEKYKEVARRNDYACDNDDIWWPDHWSTGAIWAAQDLDYLAVLTVGKDKNSRAAMIEYLKANHPEMLNPEK